MKYLKRNNTLSESRRNNLFQAKTATLFFVILLVLSSFSCRRLKFSSIDFQERKQKPGAGIELSAQFLSDPEEINQLFHTFLPDSGVIPVQVGLRNNDTLPIIVNGYSTTGLWDKVGGISLVLKGEEFLPLGPVQVMKRMIGDRAVEYRPKGPGAFVKGSILPPLGIYYAYDEATTGRLFRGLADNSLYGINSLFFFEPIVLEPGDQKTGYLYFPISTLLSPYEVTTIEVKGKEDEIRKVTKLKDDYSTPFSVKVKAVSADSDFALRGLGRDGLSFYDICFDSRKLSNTEKIRAFLLNKDKEDSGKSNLVFVEFPRPLRKPLQPENKIKLDDINAMAEIADVVTENGFAACGVNFTRKSRVYFSAFDGGGGPRRWQSDLESSILRLAFADDGVLAVCDNGYCYYLSREDGEIDKRYVKFNADLDDIFCYSDRMCVFGNNKLKVLSIDGKHLFEEIGTFDIGDADRKVVGNISNKAVLIYHSNDTPGDTLVLIDPEEGREIARESIPGKIAAASCGGEIAVQLESGVILQYSFTRGSLLLNESSLLFPRADEIVEAGGVILAAREEGRIGLFDIKDRLFSPPNFRRETPVVFSPAREKRGADDK
ncbi:MAG: hypothetical protein U5O15_00530 [Candidatus Krumholzibacteriota bacterium]|nr:hypothetical protein [Candidatus Krumholzibacteriota bacterium]